MHGGAPRRRQRLGVHPPAADDEDALDVLSSLRVRGERLKRVVQALAQKHALGKHLHFLAVLGRGVLVGGLAHRARLGQNHVEPAGQGAELGGDGLPRLPAHDHGVAQAGLVRLRGERLEVRHILGESPGELAVEADAHLVLGRGDHDLEVARGGSHGDGRGVSRRGGGGEGAGRVRGGARNSRGDDARERARERRCGDRPTAADGERDRAKTTSDRGRVPTSGAYRLCSVRAAFE